MPRTRAIFECVFAAPAAPPCALLPASSPALVPPAAASRPYSLTFLTVDDVGIDAEVLAARREREAASLAAFAARAATVTCLADLHRWVFVDHGAYGVARHLAPPTQPPLDGAAALALASY